MKCLLCGEFTESNTFKVREFMLGMGTEHEYGQCRYCGSLQILEPLKGLSRYYPDGYYSLRGKCELPLKRWARKERALYLLGEKRPIGALLSKFLKKPYFVDWLKHAHVTRDSAILDIGCGKGSLLSDLHDCGYRNLTGIDPFLDKSYERNGMRLLRQALNDISGAYDLIMFQHSLEHMSNPREAMEKAAGFLKPEGVCLVRTPVAGTWAFRTYRARWVQLDAPRHVFIPSVKGMTELASLSGLILEEVVFDACRFMIVGSEKVKRGLPFYMDERQIFFQKQLREFDSFSESLNREHNGDQACFWFKLCKE